MSQNGRVLAVLWIMLVWIWSVRYPLRWRHNGHDGVSNHQPHHCLLKRLFGCRSKKTSKLRVTGLCAGNSPGTGEFPAQMASNAENVFIWWRHHHFAKTPVPFHFLVIGWQGRISYIFSVNGSTIRLTHCHWRKPEGYGYTRPLLNYNKTQRSSHFSCTYYMCSVIMVMGLVSALE